MDDLLKIDVAVLLLRYGHQKIMSALADAESSSVDDLYQRLDRAKHAKEKRSKPKPPRSLLERLEADYAASLDKISELRPLIVAYEGGMLLPTVKAISRFLESRGERSSAIKSRKAAGPIILRVLASMEPEELRALQFSRTEDHQSDFSLLSQAILRTDRHR